MARAHFLRLAGKNAEGVRFPLLFVPDPGDAVTTRFVEQFSLVRGCAPDHAAALAYDTTRLLIEAIWRAGPNRARIREALFDLSPWKGIAGFIQFDGTGQNARTSIFRAIIRHGEVHPLPAVEAPSQPVGKN